MKNGSIKKIGQGRNTGNDFVPFEITDIASIAVAKKYAGIGASLVARIKNIKTLFSTDSGVRDIIVSNQEKRKIPTEPDDFTAPTVNTYSLEATILYLSVRDSNSVCPVHGVFSQLKISPGNFLSFL